MLGPRFDEAVRYAAVVHGAQTRKGTSIPYLSHLLTAAALVLEAGGTEDEAIAALLHDTAEDQGGHDRLADVHHRFGADVADIVRGCSDSLAATGERKEAYKERKKRYLRHLADPHTSSSVLLVAAADKTHNAQMLVLDGQLREDSWRRFNGSPRQILWYHSECLETFRKRGVPETLTHRLGQSVDEMRRQVQALPTKQRTSAGAGTRQ